MSSIPAISATSTLHDNLIAQSDWLAARNQPVALVFVEELEPAGGPEAIVFPPTYARRGGDHPYAISVLRSDISPEAAGLELQVNICDLDSVGSQANRMEPCFKLAPLAELVPQVEVQAASARVSLLDLGHRIADAAVRFSDLQEEIGRAIMELQEGGGAEALGKLAPTSLVFGFWDSRGHAKQRFPRILSSTIRATNVATLKRSAQFSPAFDPAQLGLDDGEEQQEAASSAQDDKDPLSQEGLRAAPAVDSHGGVRVFGRVVRRTEINLVAVRSLAVTNTDKTVDPAATLKLRRYILGLALVAARAQPSYDLRQGCLLVCKSGAETRAEVVTPDGRRDAFDWSIELSLDYAKIAAQEFGIGKDRTATFQKDKLKTAIEARKPAKSTKKKAASN